MQKDTRINEIWETDMQSGEERQQERERDSFYKMAISRRIIATKDRVMLLLTGAEEELDGGGGNS